MNAGSGLRRLEGYSFEVRYSDGARPRALAAAGLAAHAYDYFRSLFSLVEPDIALLVLDRTNWSSRQPYGLPYFSDDQGKIRPGVVVMSAERGDFWSAMVDDLGDTSPDQLPTLRAAYPDGADGVDLQPFFDLVTVHELAHAFEVLGDLRLPTSWLSEMFVNLAMHTFVATRLPARLPTLEVLPTVGAGSAPLAARMRAEGFSTLDESEAHYPGGDDPMGTLNYVWFQYRWHRLAAEVFRAEGEAGLLRLWDCFHGRDRDELHQATTESVAALLSAEVSQTLGRAIRDWR
jgi:hypothetical protein